MVTLRLCPRMVHIMRRWDIVMLKPQVPEEFWFEAEIQQALADRHMGKVIKAYRTHPCHGRHPLSQEDVANWVGITQAQLSRIENGPPPVHLDRLTQWAVLLDIPAEHLWFKLPERNDPDNAVPPAHLGAGGDQGDDLRRRTMLAGAAAATALPVLALDDLRRITALVDESRRSFEGTDVEFFRRRLAECANDDGAYGPKVTLPVVLGIIAAVERDSRDAWGSLRREMLGVAARSAEFAAWLYRDIGSSDTAEYWRDRAMEWAQAADDGAMQGYVLLKKSQAAWDHRDAVRMLTLAEAALRGPWRLPARVRAEAAQQQARAHAMLGDNRGDVDRNLDAAHQVLADQEAEDRSASDLSAHYGRAVLAMQTAICYCEAGRPKQAVDVYEGELSSRSFSRRDRSYFTALKGIALAVAREPDEAASAGLVSLPVATETRSARTLHELNRLDRRLTRWRGRPLVRQLHDALHAY